MLSHFFKTAVRFLWRNRTYSLLNYICLTFGLTCAIVAVLNIVRVLNYDRFHSNYERLFEVEAHVTYFNGDRFPKELLSASLPDLLRNSVPELESLARVAERNHSFTTGNGEFSEGGIYADPDFLSVFSFPLVKGDPQSALAGNNSIIISERMAARVFGSGDCLGKALIISGDSVRKAFTVTGIMKNVPAQSYLQFDFIIPFTRFLADNSWALESGATASQVWALLSPNADVTSVNSKIRDLIKHQETTLNQELFLFPLKEKILYFYSGGRRVWKEMQNLVLIGSIGFAILLIACFNFINLTIALNIKRYREAGIRKVTGARKSGIIFQHLGETFILTGVSFLTAIDLVSLVVYGLNRAFNSDVQFDFSDFGIILIFAGITLFTGLASGLLPALYLANSNPVTILRGKLNSGHSFSFFRQSLIIFQFTIPIVLIIFVLIVRQQDAFIRNFDMGFDKNTLLISGTTRSIEEHSESVRADLLAIAGVESVSFSNCVPANGARVSNEVSWEGKDPAEKLHFWMISTDFSYDKVVNLKITGGRYFDRSHPSDSSGFVINDIAAGVFGFDDPVGRTITADGQKGTIVGVFRDFHAIDLSGPFTPTIIRLSGTGRSSMLVRIAPGRYKEISDGVKAVYEKYEHEKPFQSTLYSDILKRSELTTVSRLIGLAFIVSILLACLGLTGLASFTAASRTKEIGIRKINGASVLAVMRLLGSRYSGWLVLASAFAIPLAFLLGRLFLGRFNFRTEMPYWTLLAGPLIALCIALGAVGLQSWRAASANPVDSLRYE